MSNVSHEDQIKIARRNLFMIGKKSFTFDQLRTELLDNPLTIVQIAAENDLHIVPPVGYIILDHEDSNLDKGTMDEVLGYFTLEMQETDEAGNSSHEPSYMSHDGNQRTYFELLEMENVRPIFSPSKMIEIVEFFEPEELEYTEPMISFQHDSWFYNNDDLATGTVKAGSNIPFSLVENCVFFKDRNEFEKAMNAEIYKRVNVIVDEIDDMNEKGNFLAALLDAFDSLEAECDCDACSARRSRAEDIKTDAVRNSFN